MKSSVPPSIVAVVVLYNRLLRDSPSVTSLARLCEDRRGQAHKFHLILYDNSPHPQSCDLRGFAEVCYRHDSANGGLAPAYNFALMHAEKKQCEWLLLLDQDTSLHAEYLDELFEVAAETQALPSLGAIVPKLMVNDEMHSPANNFFLELRDIRKPGPSEYRNAVGMQQRHLVAYNSGSVLRVSALRAIGGFPGDFWLDFLDHAMFHQLFRLGYRVYVMRARLVHDFSESQVASVPAWRQLNVLRARSLYVRRFGTAFDRLLYRFWLLRHARSLRRAGADAQVWKNTALAAFWWPGKDKR